MNTYSNDKKVVLLVDDEDIIIKPMVTLLTQMGYEVLPAYNGEEALKLFVSNKDRISVIILDISMPKIDGAGVLKEIFKFNPNIPVVISTGYDRYDENVQGILKNGVYTYLQKPFDVNELEDILEVTVN